MSDQPLAEHFFRQEYGHLVAVLVHRVGAQWLEDVEDAVQQALLSGLETWTKTEVPQKPSAWLYRVAHNHLMDSLRQRPLHQQLIEQHAQSLPTTVAPPPEYISDQTMHDELLRMLFACCDDAIPLESQLVMSLKILCGFGVRDIALRLFISESNVYKRLSRARLHLQQSSFTTDELCIEQYQTRLDSVHHVLYLLFTEGHLSQHTDHHLRTDLCDEAIRLCRWLNQHPVGQTPTTLGLLALMHLHRARMPSRADANDDCILLEQQNRQLWDRRHIGLGLSYLQQSAKGDILSRYHLEASIAAEHCLAPSFEATRWDRITQSYRQLEQLAPSPLFALNRALALAEWKGPEVGLALLTNQSPPAWLVSHYLWPAVLADLHLRAGHHDVAAPFRKDALHRAPNAAVRKALSQRFSR